MYVYICTVHIYNIYTLYEYNFYTLLHTNTHIYIYIYKLYYKIHLYIYKSEELGFLDILTVEWRACQPLITF